jgi:hypothetical protein
MTWLWRGGNGLHHLPAKTPPGQTTLYDLAIDGDLISGKHPGDIDQFMQAFVAEMEK